MAEISDDTIRTTIGALAKARAPKTLCPSEVARHISSDWHPLMPDVRRVAADLARTGQIVVTQKGTAVDITQARGPIRLGLPFVTDGSA